MSPPQKKKKTKFLAGLYTSLGAEDDEIQAGLQGHEFLKVKDFCGSTALFPASRYLKAKPVFYSSLHDKGGHRGSLALYYRTHSLVLTSFCLTPNKKRVGGSKR